MKRMRLDLSVLSIFGFFLFFGTVCSSDLVISKLDRQVKDALRFSFLNLLSYCFTFLMNIHISEEFDFLI